MAMRNRRWGEERIAAELRLKLGLTLSARTVRHYMPSRPRSRGDRSTQSWAAFLHNHAGVVLACDFFIVVATFQRLCVFVILDIGRRRVVHWNLTDHTTAKWTFLRRSGPITRLMLVWTVERATLSVRHVRRHSDQDREAP
jgi:putative transposase